MRFNPPREHFGYLFPDWVSFYLPSWLRDLNLAPIFIYLHPSINLLLVLATLICVGRGQLEKLRPIEAFLFYSRVRFVLIAMLSLIVVSVVSYLILNSLAVEMLRGRFLVFYLYGAFGDSWIIAVIAWLMPSQNRSASLLA
jgi:hypothetical protein